jgi:hypothetical protein
MKLSQTQEMQAMAQAGAGSAAGMQGVNPDLGPARYQMWQPQSCSGTVTVSDTYVDSDPGGEGGDGAYTDTTTGQGHGADHARLARPGDPDRRRGEHHSIHPGARTAGHHRRCQFAHRRGRTPDPVPCRHQVAETFGPYKGVGGKHKGGAKGDAGSISVEWVWKK